MGHIPSHLSILCRNKNSSEVTTDQWKHLHYYCINSLHIIQKIHSILMQDYMFIRNKCLAKCITSTNIQNNNTFRSKSSNWALQKHCKTQYVQMSNKSICYIIINQSLKWVAKRGNFTTIWTEARGVEDTCRYNSQPFKMRIKGYYPNIIIH